MPVRVVELLWVVGMAALLSLAGGCASIEGGRLYTSGTEALEEGDAELAIRDLEKAAELVPHASEVYNHLGLAYLAVGRRGDAQNAFERAVDLDCDNGSAQQNLAVIQAGSWRDRAPAEPAP